MFDNMRSGRARVPAIAGLLSLAILTAGLGLFGTLGAKAAYPLPPAAPLATPTIDGTITAGEYGNHTDGQNAKTSGSQTWYMTWDETNLYVAIDNANVAEGAVLYIDADPVSPPRGGTNANGSLAGKESDNTNVALLPFRADFVTYFKTNYREYRTDDGAGGWSTQTAGFGAYADNTTTVRELAIPWSAITGTGRPASFNFFGYVTSGTGFVFAQVPPSNPAGTIGTAAVADYYYAVTSTDPQAPTPPFSQERNATDATATATPTETATLTSTATVTATLIATATETSTATETATETATGTITVTVTVTVTETATETATGTATSTSTETPTSTATQTSTSTETPEIKETLPPTATETATGTATNTVTKTATGTATSTNTTVPTSTSTTVPSSTSTGTATSTATTVPSNTSTSTRTATAAASSTASTTATSVPTACTIQFQDVPPSNDVSSFYPYVRCLACRGVLGGYPCGGTNPQTGAAEPCGATGNPYFRPGNNITRGQIAKIVANAAGFNEDVEGQTYADVPPSDNPSSFYVYIERLTAHNVMGGYPCGSRPDEECDGQNRAFFRPSANATRAQLSKIVSNAAGFVEEVEGQTFEDVPPPAEENDPSSFYLYVERLAQRGVISGYPCGAPGEPCKPGNRPYFRPGNSVTRAQAAKIVANTFFPNCQTPAAPNR